MNPRSATRPPPPDSVAFIARTHLVMSGVFLFFAGALFVLLHDSMVFELSRNTYVFTIGLGVLYAITGALVWRGFRIGQALNHVCALLYLARPPLGMKIWKIMRSEEYRMHFRR